jgi:peptide/nickel transport system ATP-binding protein
MTQLLTVTDLQTYFKTDDGVVKAVDGVSFSIEKGKTFALVGESGCGKSVTAFSIMQLIPCPPGEIVSGTIEFEGKNLLALSEHEMQKIRGAQISTIFQEPMTSLNPVFTCGSQIVEAIRLHRDLSGRAAKELAVELIAKVGIPEPAQRFFEYPHQLSGGMRQRIMIAMALSCNPKLLIADEPTTALDVTIQAQILDLLNELQQKEGLGILLITHDLGVVAETAHDVGVMYASKLVETADVQTIFNNALHPYTQGLFDSIPKLGEKRHRLNTISGTVPNPLFFPAGCKFHTRCPLTQKSAIERDNESVEITIENSSIRVLKQCSESEPTLREISKGHFCACWECPGYAKKGGDS